LGLGEGLKSPHRRKELTKYFTEWTLVNTVMKFWVTYKVWNLSS